MKKTITLFLTSIMCATILVACAQGADANNSTDKVEQTSSEQNQVSKENTDSTTSQNSAKVTFDSMDIKGNSVTSDVLGDYDLTMINVWGTGCVPCIEEMPGLAKFYDQLPENVNMLSVCVDYEADPSFAEDILTQSNAKFTTLKVDDSLFESVLSNAQALPTTIFVDKDGNIVGDIIQGAPDVKTDEEVVDHYMEYVNERLGGLSEN